MKKIIILCAIATGLSACKTTQPLYYHGDYNNAVYSYFKSDTVSVEEQITVLEQVVEMAAAKNLPVAPGVHAHLGMLYFETGNSDTGKYHFEQEKMLFPESSQYIDFLLASAQGA